LSLLAYIVILKFTLSALSDAYGIKNYALQGVSCL